MRYYLSQNASTVGTHFYQYFTLISWVSNCKKYNTNLLSSFAWDRICGLNQSNIVKKSWKGWAGQGFCSLQNHDPKITSVYDPILYTMFFLRYSWPRPTMHFPWRGAMWSGDSFSKFELSWLLTFHFYWAMRDDRSFSLKIRSFYWMSMVLNLWIHWTGW